MPCGSMSSPDAEEFVRGHGGQLWVWAARPRCHGAPGAARPGAARGWPQCAQPSWAAAPRFAGPAFPQASFGTTPP